MKIGRNSFCPCLSGLKYKKCCLAHPERDEIANLLNAQYIDRDYVFANLKQRSATMTQFLDSLPDQLVQLLWIYINPSLDANMRSLATHGHLIIIVRQFPFTDCDFFDFAHEIGHFILALNSYPASNIISGDMRLASLGTVLTNTIMDPLVNNLVAQYGFNLNDYMQKAFRLQIPNIRSIPHRNIRDRHVLRCLCIEKILEWRILNIAIPNAFLPVFKQYHPDEYEFAATFVKSIDISQFNDVNYVREALSRLINENEMQDTIALT